jgi:hypothetical protein
VKTPAGCQLPDFGGVTSSAPKGLVDLGRRCDDSQRHVASRYQQTEQPIFNSDQGMSIPTYPTITGGLKISDRIS